MVAAAVVEEEAFPEADSAAEAAAAISAVEAGEVLLEEASEGQDRQDHQDRLLCHQYTDEDTGRLSLIITEVLREAEHLPAAEVLPGIVTGRYPAVIPGSR